MRYLALDFETGNQSSLSACALGISQFENHTLCQSQAFLIRPPDRAGKFHWGNIRVHHIKQSMVKDAPCFATLWRSIAPIIQQSVLVCHNASFDIKVLHELLLYYNLPVPTCPFICTVKISRGVWPELPNHKLNTVADFLGISLHHHEAGSDARACGLILQKALAQTGCDDVFSLATHLHIQMGMLSPTKIQACHIAKPYVPK